MQTKKVNKFTKEYFICPHCGSKENSFIHWETASIAWLHTIKKDKHHDSNESNDINEPISVVNGEFENWSCPNCRQNIDLPQCIIDNVIK
jgi:rubredoxin